MSKTIRRKQLTPKYAPTSLFSLFGWRFNISIRTLNRVSHPDDDDQTAIYKYNQFRKRKFHSDRWNALNAPKRFRQKLNKRERIQQNQQLKHHLKNNTEEEISLTHKRNANWLWL